VIAPKRTPRTPPFLPDAAPRGTRHRGGRPPRPV